MLPMISCLIFGTSHSWFVENIYQEDVIQNKCVHWFMILSFYIYALFDYYCVHNALIGVLFLWRNYFREKRIARRAAIRLIREQTTAPSNVICVVSIYCILSSLCCSKLPYKKLAESYFGRTSLASEVQSNKYCVSEKW